MSRTQASEKSVDEKRSEYEQFEFAVCPDGKHVNIKNVSYKESGHTYTITVHDGEPVSCTCPHHEHRDAFCKHLEATQDNQIVLKASESALMTDGGTEVEDTCENGNPFCEGPEGEILPCFDCFKSGDIDL